MVILYLIDIMRIIQEDIQIENLMLHLKKKVIFNFL